MILLSVSEGHSPFCRPSSKGRRAWRQEGVEKAEERQAVDKSVNMVDDPKLLEAGSGDVIVTMMLTWMSLSSGPWVRRVMASACPATYRLIADG